VSLPGGSDLGLGSARVSDPKSMASGMVLNATIRLSIFLLRSQSREPALMGMEGAIGMVDSGSPATT
jgi:hypothetical protein